MGTEVFYPSEVVDIDSLRPWPTNYLDHPDSQLRTIEQGLQTFGQFKNIVVWNGYIVDGHGLVESAKRQGFDTLYRALAGNLKE